MNKQITPAEIEFVQQSSARFAPISDKVTLVQVEAGPLPSPNIPAALALASVSVSMSNARRPPALPRGGSATSRRRRATPLSFGPSKLPPSK